MRASDTVVRRMVGPKGPRRHRRAALATVLIRPTRAAARRAACERAHGCPVRSHTALALCETVALGCAHAFERDEAGDATAHACRECARACRALRTSVARVRMHGVAA